MTLIMSCKVDYLHRRLSMFNDDQLIEKMKNEGMQIGEELLGYVMGISFVNDREGNNESDITIKNLEETTKRIGFEKQKIYTDHDMHGFVWHIWKN